MKVHRSLISLVITMCDIFYYNTNNNLPETLNYWVCIRLGLVCLMDRGDSSALDGNQRILLK